MFGLPRRHSTLSQSWFALKKEEFYVILDTVLTEMTSSQGEEKQRDVTGCMELIKLLNDSDASREVGAKNAQSGDESGTIGAKGEPETEKLQTEAVVGGRRFRSRGLEASSGRRDDRSKPGFDRNATSADENSQLCLSDTRVNHSTKISEDCCSERRQRLRQANCGSQNLEPNRLSGTPGRTDFSAKSSCKDPSSSSSSCLYPKRSLTDVPDAVKTMRKSCDRHHHHHRHHRTDVSKSVSGQRALFLPSSIRFDGRTPNRGVVSAPSSCCRAPEVAAPKQKLRSQNRGADDSGNISEEIANLEQESENYVWTAVDKSVINEIVDSLLLDPSLKKSYVTRDVTACNSVKPGHALSAVLGGKSRIKTEDAKSDDFVTPRSNGNRRGDDVGADVKLVDVTRRFDVTEMGFKWKSKLLWRMNRDRASRNYPAKLCMT